MKLVKNENEKNINNEVTDKEAEEAFVKILKWLGEDPTREGLLAVSYTHLTLPTIYSV